MDLQQIDHILLQYSRIRYNYSALTPINTKEEMDKFFQNDNYNPQFRYNKTVSPDITKIQDIKIPSSPLGKIFDEVRNKIVLEAKMIAKIGTNDFNTKPLFAELTQELYEQAKNILTKTNIVPTEKEKTVSANELKNKLDETIKKYGLKGWEIIFLENAAATVSVTASKKIINIRKDEFFSEDHVKKLIVHEIETHVLRAANGERQQYKLFSVGLPNYLATEEGLAGYNERTNNVANPISEINYARNVIATKLSSEKSFREVYNQIIQTYENTVDEKGNITKTKEEKAFMKVMRVKRGLGDTSNPGGYLKDHAYLAGMNLVEEYVKKGKDIRLLYAGKIGVEHVHLVEEKIIKKAEILPIFLE